MIIWDAVHGALAGVGRFFGWQGTSEAAAAAPTYGEVELLDNQRYGLELSDAQRYGLTVFDRQLARVVLTDGLAADMD